MGLRLGIVDLVFYWQNSQDEWRLMTKWMPLHLIPMLVCLDHFVCRVLSLLPSKALQHSRHSNIKWTSNEDLFFSINSWLQMLFAIVFAACANSVWALRNALMRLLQPRFAVTLNWFWFPFECNGGGRPKTHSTTFVFWPKENSSLQGLRIRISAKSNVIYFCVFLSAPTTTTTTRWI